MSHWNYRVKRISEDTVGVFEAYYNDDGKIVGLSEDAVCPTGETVEDIRERLMLVLEALEEPLIE